MIRAQLDSPAAALATVTYVFVSVLHKRILLKS
jgi:hypothetical protein